MLDRDKSAGVVLFFSVTLFLCFFGDKSGEVKTGFGQICTLTKYRCQILNIFNTFSLMGAIQRQISL